METLSIIIPVWGDRNLVPVLYDRLVCVLNKMPVEYRIIYVNDACPFGSGEELKILAEKDSKVTVINFTRNFGELAAVKAGIDLCDTDWAVIMDCDLQDRPEDIPELYNKAKEGFDVVWGERIKRNDNILKKFLSKMFYITNNILSEIKVNRKIGSFSIISRKVINGLKEINDYTFNYMYCIKFLGFKEAYIPIIKDKREIGKSGYNIIKGIAYAIKIIAFSSNRLLLIPVFSTFFIFIITLLLLLLVYLGILKEINQLGILIFICFIVAIICMNISILGIYIGMIFKEISTKPHYVINNINKKGN